MSPRELVAIQMLLTDEVTSSLQLSLSFLMTILCAVGHPPPKYLWAVNTTYSDDVSLFIYISTCGSSYQVKVNLVEAVLCLVTARVHRGRSGAARAGL